MTRCVATALAVVVGLASAGPSAQAFAAEAVQIALPFPNGAAWPYFAVAEELGYFADEGLEVELQVTSGSAASYKALVTGQVDFAFTQPAQVLNGLVLGEETTSLYTAYQGHVYQLVVPVDSPYQRVADLKGTTTGISSLAGGQYAYLLATLENAGLSVGPGQDVELAEVGRGGAAAVSLQDKRISAYSGSFVDTMAIELKGIPLRRLMEGPTATFFSDSLVARTSDLTADPQAAIGLARAIAKATQFCFDNTEACWNSISKMVPDNAKSPEFTKPLLNAVLGLHEPKDEAKGWGHQDPEAWQAIHDFLMNSEQLKRKVDVSRAFTNAYIDEINEFDAAAVTADAAAYQ